MILFLLLLSCAQAPADPRIAELDHESPEVREAAAKDLIARGPALAGALFEHYRASKSAEVRARIEAILYTYPFAAYFQARPGEALRERLEARILQPLDDHRGHAGCWKDKGAGTPIDLRKLHIVWQDGSGHGQMLRLKWIDSDDAGGLRLRRLVYQGTTPYRPKVTAEGVSVDEARLGAMESSAMAALLDRAIALKPDSCAIPQTPGRYVWSSASFSVRLRIESAGAELWSCGYTGYPGTSGRQIYAHSRAVENVLDQVMASTTWSSAELTRQDRARASAWILARFETEEWWIKEHYLHTAKFAGDPTLLPLLKKVAEMETTENQYSEKRQVEEAREALKALDAEKK